MGNIQYKASCNLLCWGGFVAAATIPLMIRSTWVSFDHCCTKKLQRSESDALDRKQNAKFKLVLCSFTD